MRRALLLPVIALSLALACVGSTQGEDEQDSAGGEPLPSACFVDADAPRTIEELVAHIQTLPRPLTLPCFLASLPRPLRVVSTTSVFSIQPAEGPHNPRIFILTEGIVYAIVPSGDGHPLLELSEWRSSTRTIKAELTFPIDGDLSPEAPYALGLDHGVTRCGLCHREESPVDERPGAYESDAMRPLPSSLVELETLREARETCDGDTEPSRCAMLSALLDHGPVEAGAFSDELDTFFP